MLSRYEVIFFDAGGTLFRPHPSVGEIYSRAAARHGCTADSQAVETRFRDLWHQRDAMHSLASHSSEKIEKDWWRSLVAEVFRHFPGLRDFDVFFDELYMEFAGPDSWRLFPETREVLEALKARGKKLCVISNWDSRLYKLCEGLQIDHYFEFILISAVFGASKPNPRIFEEALRRAGVGPERAIHIGDSIEDDVHGARRAGMKSVLIDRHQRRRADPGSFEQVTVIHDLRELLDF